MTDNVTDRLNNPTKTKPFRFANRWLMLTYKTHLNKEEFIAWFEEDIGFKPEFIRCAHEFGTNHPEEKEDYAHTHVAIDFGTTVNHRNCRKWDYKGIHPHFAVYKNKHKFKICKGYIGKEDPDNADLKEEEIPPIQLLWKNKTLGEAVSKLKSLSMVTGAVAAWNLKPEELDEEKGEPREWQMHILDWCAEMVNRKILWVYDPVGNCGKSWFTNYVLRNFGDKYHCVKGLGNQRDNSSFLDGLKNSGWGGDSFIIDLPKGACFKDIYTPIEDIKDGMFTTTKWMGKTRVMKKCHVVVMSNWLPNINKVSLDRWAIVRLEKPPNHSDRGEPITLKALSLQEAQLLRKEDVKRIRLEQLEEEWEMKELENHFREQKLGHGPQPKDEENNERCETLAEQIARMNACKRKKRKVKVLE